MAEPQHNTTNTAIATGAKMFSEQTSSAQTLPYKEKKKQGCVRRGIRLKLCHTKCVNQCKADSVGTSEGINQNVNNNQGTFFFVSFGLRCLDEG